MKLRVGIGYDVHRIEEGSDFTLGGIKIPHYKGAIGHSDADTLIHAICDSLLGAANLKDIGSHFPDSFDKFKNIDSKILLEIVVSILLKKGYTINNIDSTICLQEPKIAPYIPKMIETLAPILNLDIDDLSIKATTTEKLGFVGKEEGISAYAVSLIQKS